MSDLKEHSVTAKLFTDMKTATKSVASSQDHYTMYYNSSHPMNARQCNNHED